MKRSGAKSKAGGRLIRVLLQMCHKLSAPRAILAIRAGRGGRLLEECWMPASGRVGAPGRETWRARGISFPPRERAVDRQALALQASAVFIAACASFRDL
jgi:hypothetical protein